MENHIKLIHGDGGKQTSILIKDLFYKHFNNEFLTNSLDAAMFPVNQGKLAFTTDSFVVKPLIFPGGDIGKLAVCGTINDLVVSGATPMYLSCGFIIEEGIKLAFLEQITQSMGEECIKSNVKIITGDTKVVEKGSVDGVFINTSGIGIIENGYQIKSLTVGDAIIITGGIAEHGTTIAIERYQLNVKGNIKSDCMALSGLLKRLEPYINDIKIMKDPTRGGLATSLNEISEYSGMSIELSEEQIPIKPEIRAVNQLLGFDPLYLACEGRMVLVVPSKLSQEVLKTIKMVEGCEDAAIIGQVVETKTLPKVYMKTWIGGKKIIHPLEDTILPRIC